jgi:hypothetical protein
MADAFPISGNIDPKAFPFLLTDLHRQGATGSLKVDGPSYQKALYFRAGRILFGSSNDPRDQLGSILIENGKITPEQLEDVNTKVGPGNPLAKVLAESGFVNQRELGEAARAKVERIVSDVIAYSSGSFEFEDGVLPKGAVDLKLSTEKLILSAVQRISDRNFVLLHLESLAVVLAPTEDLATKLPEIESEAGGLPERLDGARTLKEAAAFTRLDEFDAAKVACALLFLGLVQRAEARAAVEPEVAPEAGVADGGLDFGHTVPMAFPVGMDSAAADTGSRPGPSDSEPSAFYVDPSAEPTGFAMAEPAQAGFAMPEPEPTGFAVAEPPAYGSDSSPGLGYDAEPETPAFGISEAAEYTEAAPPFPPIEVSEAPAFVMPEPEPATARPPYTPPPYVAPAYTPPAYEPPYPPPPPEPEEEADFSGTNPAQPAPYIDAPATDPLPARAHDSMASRPSKEDLAALDALLNASHAGPLEPMERPAPRSERWEPQFPTARGRKPNRRRSLRPLLAVFSVVALAAAAAGWYYMKVGLPSRTAPSPRAEVRPSPVPVGSPLPEPTIAASALPTVAPTPAVTVDSLPSPVAASPSAAAAVPSAPPSPAPAESVRPAGGTGLAQARELLRQGSFDDAARTFATSVRDAPGSSFSVQILVACSSETVQKAFDSVPSTELYILPVNFRGRDCYRLCWGLYESEARASSALRSLPEYFRKGGAAPKVVPTAGMLP